MASSIYGGYLGATYRSGHDFKTAMKGSFFASILSSLVLPFFALWPYLTMAIRNALSSIGNLAYLHHHRPLRLPWRFVWSEWFTLVKHGFPIFVASYGAGTLWITVESTIVLKELGTAALGLWSVSYFVFDAAKRLPEAMVTVYIPRVIESIGRTESIRESFSVCRKPLIWGVPISLVIAAAGWIASTHIHPHSYSELYRCSSRNVPDARRVSASCTKPAIFALGGNGKNSPAKYRGLCWFGNLCRTVSGCSRSRVGLEWHCCCVSHWQGGEDSFSVPDAVFSSRPIVLSPRGDVL